MWNHIAAGAVDVILATELSRLSRSVKDFLELISHCKNHSVDVIIIGLNLDTTSAGGRMMLIMLIGMAQFEREITSERVSKNALSRLIEHGKINGASEILGLGRDPNKRGHFLINQDELEDVKKILRIYIKCSSRSKTLEQAKTAGLKGKRGEELTLRTIDTILLNTQWRYRGYWYLNKENELRNQAELAESERFKLIELPHGQLIETELLDQVQEKIKLNFDKNRRTGLNDYTYLLSHLLYYEDDSRFTGVSAKSGANRYYYNYDHKIRIPCIDVDKIILARFKLYLQNSFKFETLLEQGLKRREADMPKINQQISKVKTELEELIQKEVTLSNQLLRPENSNSESFMAWLKKEVELCGEKRSQLNNTLLQLDNLKNNVLEKAGLGDVKKSVIKYVEAFNDLSGTQKRDLLQKFVKKIVLSADKKLEIQMYWGSGARPAVTPRKKSSTSKLNGGPLLLHSVMNVPPLEVSDFIPFVHTSLFKNKEFLQQKYVAEGLSIAQIAEQIVSSKEAVREALIRFSLPIRQACLPHGRPAQPRFGLRYRRQALINYKPEQRVIDTIVELKNQGLGLRQIARTLSKLKIPTKLSGVAWHPMMVKRVLNYLKKKNS